MKPKRMCIMEKPHFLHALGSLNSWLGIYDYTDNNQSNESVPP